MSLPRAYEPDQANGHGEPFYVVEGVSGIGKSTLAERLKYRLEDSSLHTFHTPHNGWSVVANKRLQPLPHPTAVVVETDGKSADELADWIIRHVEGARA